MQCASRSTVPRRLRTWEVTVAAGNLQENASQIVPLTFVKIGVIGGGTMGAGIAEVCAKSGSDVVVIEVKQEFADAARALPQVGSGEPVGDLMTVLGAADAAIVLVEGKPTGVVSRQDLLAFLAKGGGRQ